MTGPPSEDTSVRWFGPTWHAPVCDAVTMVPTPIGEPCARCAEAIRPGDRGLLMWHAEADREGHRPYHLDCHLRMTSGGVGHQLGLCACYGGTLEDPPWMTTREAAAAAVAVKAALDAIGLTRRPPRVLR